MTATRDMAEAVNAQHRADGFVVDPDAAREAAVRRMVAYQAEINDLIDRYGIVLDGDPRRLLSETWGQRTLQLGEELLQRGARVLRELRRKSIQGSQQRVAVGQRVAGGLGVCDGQGQQHDLEGGDFAHDLIHQVSPVCVEPAGEGESAGRETAPPTNPMPPAFGRFDARFLTWVDGSLAVLADPAASRLVAAFGNLRSVIEGERG